METRYFSVPRDLYLARGGHGGGPRPVGDGGDGAGSFSRLVVFINPLLTHKMLLRDETRTYEFTKNKVT